MSVRIRLRRIGKRPRKRPFFRVVVVEKGKARDGRCIEEIGFYNPTKNPSHINIKKERYNYWLKLGAQPSETVMNLIKKTGGQDAESSSS